MRRQNSAFDPIGSGHSGSFRAVRTSPADAGPGPTSVGAVRRTGESTRDREAATDARDGAAADAAADGDGNGAAHPILADLRADRLCELSGDGRAAWRR